jgi:hypothetical protein
METTIHKCTKSRHYTKISNAVLQDDKLTLKEIGLMAYILSLPDNWVICLSHLNERYGRGTVAAALAKLKELGYMHHNIERDSATNRIKSHSWTAYDDPSENPHRVHKQLFQSVEFPEGGKVTTTKETGNIKEIAYRKTMCSFPEPKERVMPSVESIYELYPEIDERYIDTAYDATEEQLAKGKKINSIPAFIAGLARKVESDMPTNNR